MQVLAKYFIQLHVNFAYKSTFQVITYMPLFMSWQLYYNKFTSMLVCICTSSIQFLVSVLAVQISKIQRLKVPSSCDLVTLNNFLGKNHLPFQACLECIPRLFTGLHKYERVLHTSYHEICYRTVNFIFTI